VEQPRNLLFVPEELQNYVCCFLRLLQMRYVAAVLDPLQPLALRQNIHEFLGAGGLENLVIASPNNECVSKYTRHLYSDAHRTHMISETW
jgi:hypothetical protein